MSCRKYLETARKVRDKLLAKYGSLKGRCHDAIKLLYEEGLKGVPLAIFFKHPYSRTWSSHVVFVTLDLCVIDVTGCQYHVCDLVYPIYDIKKKYSGILCFDIIGKFFYALKEFTSEEDALRDRVTSILRDMGILSKAECQEVYLKYR